MVQPELTKTMLRVLNDVRGGDGAYHRVYDSSHRSARTKVIGILIRRGLLDEAKLLTPDGWTILNHAIGRRRGRVV